MSESAPPAAAPARARWLLPTLWALTTACLVVAFARIEWRGVAELIAAVHPALLAAAVVANFAIIPLWVLQWKVFLPPAPSPSLRRLFEVISIKSTVSNGGPPLAGHAAGVHLLATRGGAGWPAALSVLALDQLTEGTAKVLLLAAVAAAAPMPDALRGVALALGAGVGALWAGMLTLARWPAGPSRPDGESALGARGLRARAQDVLAAASRHLEALRHPGILALGVALALGMKAAELGGILAVQWALGVKVGLGASLLVLACVGLATMVSVTPANLGVYEASAFAAYRLAGVDAEMATALALVQHVVFLVPVAGTGWALVTLRGVRGALVTGGGGSNGVRMGEPVRLGEGATEPVE